MDRPTSFGSRTRRSPRPRTTRCWSRCRRSPQPVRLGGAAGKPLYARIMGLLRPRHHILGSDIAGRVEATGRATTRSPARRRRVRRHPQFHGRPAEYVCVPERSTGANAGRHDLRGSRGPSPSGRHRAAGHLGHRAGPARAEGLDQRRRWRLGHVRRPARQAAGPRSPGWTTQRSWSSCAHLVRTTSSTTRGQTSPGMGATTT